MKLVELTRQRKHAIDKADAIIAGAERGKRELTPSENLDIDTCLSAAKALEPQIKSLQDTNTLSRMMTGGRLLTSEGRGFQRSSSPAALPDTYASEFFDYLQSAGEKIGATLYEGSNPAGGYAVPTVVDDQVVPLAPQEMSVRRLSTVLATVSDIKFPVKTAFGSAALKAETASFGGTALTIGQFTLSAYMVGAQNDLSWELVQDVPSFQATTLQDMVLSQQMLEESYYIAGTGSGQPQGLIGNVGVGVTEEPDSSGNIVSISGILDLIGTLNAVYHPGASFLMSRSTSVGIRKAQVQANLFEPAFTRVGQQDFLFGYPVEYSTDMPAADRGNVPVLFGDFKRGYLIGDRGGSGINVKVLDQPKAAQGLITLLTYRRTDGRVRLAEAIQPYYIAAS